MQTYDTFAVTNNPKVFSHLYQFQEELDKEYKKEIFFDSSDLISMIYGLNDFYEIQRNRDHVFKSRQFKNKMVMVQSLAYFGYLGKINLLNPHLFEFIEILTPQRRRLSEKLRLQNTIEIIVSLDLINPTEIEIKSKDIKELLPFDTIKEEAEHRFKLSYLLDRDHPKKRANYLKDEEIINLTSSSQFNISNYTESNLFKEAYSQLNEKRPKKNHNNFHDALALCQLQEKLESNEDNLVPILYARSEVFSVAKKLNDSFILENNRRPFEFVGKKGSYNIVQSEDFFILDALYNNYLSITSITDNTFSDFIYEIDSFYDTTNRVIDSRSRSRIINLSPEGQQLKDSTKEAVHYKFMRNWWENSGANDLRKTLHQINGLSNVKIEESSFEYVEEGFSDLLNHVQSSINQHSLGLKYIKVAFNKKFIESLKDKHSNLGKLTYDLEQEFLTRFAYPEYSIKAIKLFIERLYLTACDDDITKHDDLKIEMLTTLQDVLNYDVLSIKDDSQLEHLNKLCVMLSILWIEEEFELLNLFCDEIRSTFQKNNRAQDHDYYPNYQLALLHCAALIRIKPEKILDYQKIVNILNCIKLKYDSTTYKSWVGQSFIYAKLWEHVSISPSIPELHSKVHNLSKLDNDRRISFYKISSDYALKAIDKISELLNAEEQQENRLIRRYYAINVYIYMETTNRDLGDFPGNLRIYVQELQSIPHNRINHERYLDTLARYNQRMAAKVAIEENNEVKYLNYLESAHRYINDAKRMAQSKNNLDDILLFNSLLNEIEYMRNEGMDFMENYEG